MVRSRMPVTLQLFLLLVLVLIINAGAYLFILQNVYQEELRSQAKTVVANVEAFSAWVSRSGQIWVKDGTQDYLSTETVQALDEPDNVYHFYSKNPALATREFSEVVAQSPSPAKFRMTSHNVINPRNQPNAFELDAINKIRSENLTEYFDSTADSFRYASPLYHKASCIRCHGDPAQAPQDVLDIYGSDGGFGFKEGDVAGIISVTLPKKNLWQSTMSMFSLVEVGIIFLSILPIMWFVRRAIIVPVKTLTAAADNISKGQEADVDISAVPQNSQNEIHQLMLATARMRSSFTIATRKMKEARAQTDKAIRYAKALKAKL